MKRTLSFVLAALFLGLVSVSCGRTAENSGNTVSLPGQSGLVDSTGSTSQVSDTESFTSQGGSTMNSSQQSNTSNRTSSTNRPVSSADSGASHSESGAYDVTKDPFYNKRNIYCTWLNVWDGATEAWWNADSSSGTKVIYDGVKTNTQSLDWSDPDLQQFYLGQVKAAGINAVVMDLTNGLRWMFACEAIRDFVAQNGMKYAAAINSADLLDFENKAMSIYECFADPELEKGSAYLYKDGKPVLVAYVGSSFWDGDLKQGNPMTEYASKFTIVWASGEDSRADKWGWQIPAKDGPQASRDSMFVTSSINWTAPSWSMTGWRKNLAYLDYGFLVAKKNNPKYIIVSSFDDMRERHGWIKADTGKVSFNYNMLMPESPTIDKEGTPGMIMRDVYGNISTDAYYNRTVSWIKGTAKAYQPGGIIKDGAYLIKNAATGKGITSENPSAYNPENGARPIDRTNDRVSVPAAQIANPGYQQYYFFYHLGNQEYRIVRICIGLSLQDTNGTVTVEYDSTDAGQRWRLEKAGGNYLLVNKATGKAMTVKGGEEIGTASKNASDKKQQWSLTPIALMD